MRKFLFVLLLVLVASIGFAQMDVPFETSAGIGWTAAPAIDGDGNPLLPTDIIEYEVAMFDMANGDPMTAVPGMWIVVATVSTAYIDPLPIPYRAVWAIKVTTKVTDIASNVVYGPGCYSVVAANTRDGAFVITPITTWVPMPVTSIYVIP